MIAMLLRATDVEQVVGKVGRDVFMEAVIVRLRAALEEIGNGTRPPSSVRAGFVRGAKGDGVLEWMPYRSESEGVTIKLVGYTPTNPLSCGLPTITAVTTRFDEETGSLTACADSVLLTAIRTGAASAIASELLAEPTSRTLGIVGAGAQAVTQLHALSRGFDLRRVLVWDTDPLRAKDFANRVEFVDVPVQVLEPAEMLPQLDILCTATAVGVGAGPVIEDQEHAAHLHINAVGSDLIGKTELPPTLLERAVVCPDMAAQARVEGECQQLDAERIGPDLTRLCADPAGAARLRSRLTVFDSTGLSVEDHVALDVLLSFAAEMGVGLQAEWNCRATDPFDPYAAVE